MAASSEIPGGAVHIVFVAHQGKGEAASVVIVRHVWWMSVVFFLYSMRRHAFLDLVWYSITLLVVFCLIGSVGLE